MGLYKAEKHQEVKELWKVRLAECKKSGLSARAWCAEHDVPYKQFIYRKSRDTENTPCSKEAFLEIEDSPSPVGIELALKDITIKLSKDFDSLALERCLKVLKAL